MNLLRRGRHDWAGWEQEFLVEPGISDVESGRWARVQVRCRKCGEERKVWFGIDRDHPGLVNGCRG